MNKRHTYWILALVFVIGLSLLLYPTVSEAWNRNHQAMIVQEYEETVESIEDVQNAQMLADACAYNESILKRSNVFLLSEDEKLLYDSLLRVDGTDVIARIEIPRLEVNLPIYHGTEDDVLQTGIGHIEWSSLPVGGEGTHCVISGHRGLPSSRLFTDLDELEEGDIFMLYVLGETLTYEVDQILIVEPDDVSDLQIVQGKDLCTLVTCTPYGINTHRLLVRGHRVENIEEAEVLYVSADAVKVEPLVVVPVLLAPVLLAIFVWIVVRDIRNAKANNKRKKPR